MAILLKTSSVRVSSIQIMQIRVQNEDKSVWKSRYDGDISEPSRVDRGSSIWGCLLLFWFRSRALIVLWMMYV